MPHIHTDRWSLEIPDDWLVDHDEAEGLVSICDPDEIGCLDLRVLENADNAPVDKTSLTDIARISLQESDKVLQNIEDAEVGQFAGVTIGFIEDNLAWREWYLSGENFLLMISYNTDEENISLDDAVIEQILDTLVIESAVIE